VSEPARKLEAVPPDALGTIPHAPDAEASVAVASVLSAAALDSIADFLRPDHFFLDPNRRIYEACLDLRAEKTPVDPVSVVEWLRGRDRLRQIGGAGGFLEIMNSNSVIGNVRAHATAIHDAWRRRKMVHFCEKVAGEGRIGVGDVQGWLDGATRELAALTNDNPARPIESNEQTLKRLIGELFDIPDPGAAATGSVVTGFPTGIYGLDRLLGGLHKGAKTTIAGTTGAGKTTVGCQFAFHLANGKAGVGIFSTEVKRDELLMRQLSSESRIPFRRIRDRRLSSADRFNLMEAKDRIDALPVRIDETPRINADEIATKTKKLSEEMRLLYGVPLIAIVVDYIQRLEPPRHMLSKDKHEQIAYNTRRLKLLAQEMDIAVIELAQAKALERGKKQEKPHASNCIADSSAVAKEADNVIVLAAENEGTEEDPRIEVTTYVVKQRSGAKGHVTLEMRGDIYTFRDPNAPTGGADRQYVDDRPEPGGPRSIGSAEMPPDDFFGTEGL
jgi:replicative DNA helicase